MRIVPIALVIALSPSLALAQSWTATTGTHQTDDHGAGVEHENQSSRRATSRPPRVGQKHRFARGRGRGRRQSH